MKKQFRIGFLVLEALLYLSFMTLDVFEAGDTTWLKFGSILLVAAAALAQAQDGDSRLLAAALCVTAAADVFLLVLDRWYAVGILLFMVVQLLYAIRLKRDKFVFYRFAAAIPAILILSFGIHLTNALALTYILLFLINVVQAGIQALKNHALCSLLFFAGLTLFFCCDLCVGLYHISEGSVWQFARVAMWGFYLPGQVLILVSGRKEKG